MLARALASSLARCDIHYGWVMVAVTFLVMVSTAAALGVPGVMLLPLHDEYGWSLGSIAGAIKDCLRCGKCKPPCATHVPRANLLYSPRNKILATSLLIEAILYEEQTRRGVSLAHYDEFGDVADHCTVCHKCESPCPVDIDFGDVSIAMRNLLAKLRKRRPNIGTWAAMQFLIAQDPTRVKLIKAFMIDFGFRAQRRPAAVAELLIGIGQGIGSEAVVAQTNVGTAEGLMVVADRFQILLQHLIVDI
jgi:L-lactate utilization protein LutB